MTLSPPSARRFSIAVLLGLAVLASAASAQTPLPGFTKSFSPPTIGPGSTSTLRFDITNPGSVAVRNLAFTDTLPAGVVLATPANPRATCLGTLDAPDGGGTVAFNGGGIGAATSCFIAVDVTSSVPGTHTNVSSDLTSDAGNSGSATADLTVATNRPGFTKSFSPAAVVFGGRSRLTFTVDNTANGNGMVNLTFNDNLPTGMVIASPANASATCSGGLIGAPAGGSVVTYGPAFFSDASVAAGASCTVGVDVLGNAVGLLGNTSGELTSNPAGGGAVLSSGKASATLEVTVESLSLTKSFTDDPVAPGDTVTLEFTVRNLDRRLSASDIEFMDQVGDALSGLVAIGLPIADVCGSGSTLSGTDLIRLDDGNLPAEGSCTFSVTLQVPASADPGVYTNTTGPITADVDGRLVTGNRARDDLFVTAAPRLTKTFLDNPVAAGGVTTLEFTISNTSTLATASDIAFTDDLGAFLSGITVVSASLPAPGFCGAGSSIVVSGGLTTLLSVTGASLAAGDSCTFAVDLTVPAGAGSGSYVNTTSTITATVDGEAATGKAASDELVVRRAPLLRKEFTDDPVAPGGAVTLQFTLTNAGEAAGDATDIAFTDDLDAALSGLVATGLPVPDVCGIGSEVAGTMTLSFTGGSLAAGESCSFGVTLQVPETAVPGSYTNTTSSVVATVEGSSVAAPAASADLQVAGLELTKEFIDDPVTAGGTVTLRFVLTNSSSTAAASNIVFSDDLDAALSGLAAITPLPLSDPCGSGSTLSGQSGNRFLSFNGGSLAAGASCTFDVSLQVPTGAASGVYANTTSNVVADVGGATVVLEPAVDGLTVSSELLLLTKEFTNDPAEPGGTVDLRFTLTNLASEQATDIAFTDDLDAALPGLEVFFLPPDPCGITASVSGTDVLTFSGGILPAGGSCSFTVTLSVPSDIPSGTTYTNVTSQVTGTVAGLTVIGDPASDDLFIDFLTFTKSFGGPVEAGDTVALTFNIQNPSTTTEVSGLDFSDDLGSVLPGLAAIGLPAFGVCGGGSVFDGTSFLTFSGGSLLPGGSCSFSVDLLVPAGSAAGTYVNTTSDLRQAGLRVAAPATAELTVIEVTDDDGDGVLDDVDVCLGTVIPEGVPTVRLGTNRYALVDGDGIFDTTPPNGNGPGAVFTIFDTAGCSCEQIIFAQGLGEGHVKFGCSLGAMREWVDLVNP